MSLLTILYAMVSGIALTVGVVNLIIWGGKSGRLAYLLSAGMALAAGAHALLELAVAKSATPESMMLSIRWENLAVAATLLFMVWFVKIYLAAGRAWLVGSITFLWLAGLVVNFTSGGSLTFSAIHAIRPFETFWGESYYLVEATTNPLKFMADAASLLIMVFVIDASLSAWRRGTRRRAFVIGGSITFFIVVAGIHTPLVDAGIVTTPTIISAAFLAIIAAMSFELARDVSRSRTLSDEVRAGRERWRALLETVQLVVLDIDAQGRIRYANPYFRDMSGRADNATLGRPVRELLNSTAIDDIHTELQQNGGPLRPHDMRMAVVDAAGNSRQLAMTIIRLNDGEGNFAGVLCVAADITDSMETTQDLAQTRRQLDRLMRSNLLGEFASSLAHELSQPLAAVLANAQVARRYLDQSPAKLDEAREVVDLIIQDDKRAADLIAQLRTMLSLGEVRRETFDLHVVLEETLGMLGRELSNQDINVELLQDPNPLRVNACRVEIQQVVLNLMLNAMQAVGEISAGERTIRVAAARTPDSARIEIRDTGPGIPPTEANRIFEAFNSGRRNNMGLGLSICRRILEAHDGLISMANNTPRGAIFEFSLPLPKMEGHAGEGPA